MPLLVTGGRVRGEEFQIEVSGPVTEVNQLTLRFEGGCGRVDLPVDLSKPQPHIRVARHAAEGDAPARISILVSKTLVTEPFGKISVLVRENEKFRKIPFEAGSFFLKNLYADTEEEFANNFFRNRNRIKDKETLAFAVEQTLIHYKLSSAHKAVCLVIFIYRAIEFGSKSMAERAVEYAAEIMPLLSQLSVDGNPRTDRHHLTMSVNLALWHLAIFNEDKNALVKILHDGFKYMVLVEKPWAIMAFNSCRTCLFLGFVLERMGDVGKARGVHRKNLEFYKVAIQAVDKFSTHFLEMAQAHHAVYLSLLSAERLRDGKEQIDIDTLFDAIMRTKDGEAGASMKRKLGLLMAALTVAPSSSKPAELANVDKKV